MSVDGAVETTRIEGNLQSGQSYVLFMSANAKTAMAQGDIRAVILDGGVTSISLAGSTDSLGGVTGTARVPHVYSAKGAFTITLSVEDDDGDTGEDTLDVRVLDIEDVVRLCIEHLRALLAQGSYSKKTTKALTKALAELEGNNGGKAQNGVLAALAKGKSSNALLRVRRAILEIQNAQRLDPSLEPALSICPHMLALAAKSKALEEIDEARSRIRKFVDLGKVMDAEDYVAAGDASLAAGDTVTAVWHYERACREVQSIR